MLVAHVVAVGHGLAASSDDLIDDLLGGVAQVVHDDLGSFGGEQQGVLTAEAAPRPGDDGDPSVQCSHVLNFSHIGRPSRDGPAVVCAPGGHDSASQAPIRVRPERVDDGVACRLHVPIGLPSWSNPPYDAGLLACIARRRRLPQAAGTGTGRSTVSPSPADSTAAAMARTRVAGPHTTTYSVLRRWETVPTLRPLGSWMPIRAPT